MKLSKLRLVSISLYLLTATVTIQAAPIFYSINPGNDTLVSIDPQSGLITTVGSLGIDVTNVDLTYANGQLYGLRSTGFLLEIDRVTGQVTQSTQILRSGVNAVERAEGLTHVGNQLKVAFGTTSSAFLSDYLADLALDGTISNEIAFGGTTDFDGLGVDENGQLYSSDGLPPNPNETRLYEVDINTVSLNLIDRYNFSTTRSNDVDVLGDDFYFIRDSLYRRSFSSGNLEQITPTVTGPYTGLAIAPPLAAAPIATTLMLLLTGLPTLLIMRHSRLKPIG